MTEETELEALKREVADLKQRVDPPPRPPSTYAPRDYTEGMSMDRSAIMEMAKAIPESVMRALRADALKPNPVTVSSGMTKPTASEPPKTIGTRGWVDARPLTPPEQNNLRYKKDLASALDHLKETGQLIFSQDDTGGRPSPRYSIPEGE